MFGLHPATEYGISDDASFDVVGNTDGSTVYYEHEKGTDDVTTTAITAIAANIQSGDYDINGESLGGDGEVIMKIRRFVPDFRALDGNAKVTLNLKDFPSDTEASSSLGPFTVSSSTQKVDTRARARAINLKIENVTTNESWRYGTFKADVQQDGRR